ncbi:MAG: hypothetical protein ACOX9E_12680 [Lentisphaeria bacterium]|jgi:hypothetical protein
MRIMKLFLLCCISCIGVSIANSSNKNWEITHKLIKEANTVDKQILDRTADKGTSGSAKLESRRAWEKVEAHLNSLSLDELVETAAAAAEYVVHRTELTAEWEREAAAVSDVGFVLSIYSFKNPTVTDFDSLVQRIKNSQESVYFRIALLSWFRDRIMQEKLAANYADHIINSVIQASRDVLCDPYSPESLRLVAYHVYTDAIIQDILSTCKKNDVLRLYLGSSGKHLDLFKHLVNEDITVPDETKQRLLDGNKNISWLLDNFSLELKKGVSERVKSMINFILRKLYNIPMGETEYREMERLRAETVKK